MQIKRHRDDRGPTDAGWLKSMHTFSFGGYYDPKHMGFGPLRVINDDRVVPGAGFGTHPHRNMEIISIVLEGSLAHKDSMGIGSVIKPGEVQVMSAGTGVTHSEFNGSETEHVRFLQIWIMPGEENTEPSYQQEAINGAESKNVFRLLVSKDGEAGSLLIKQDVRLFGGKFDEGKNIIFKTELSRKYWVQITGGSALVNGEIAADGDGFAISGEEEIDFKATTQAEALLFELPA